MVDPARVAHRRLVAVVRSLDWLARFRIEHGPAGTGLTVVDRDGRALAGARAVALALSRLPVTAWPALPATVARVRAPSGAASVAQPIGGPVTTRSTALRPAARRPGGPRRCSASGSRLRPGRAARALPRRDGRRAAGVGHRGGRLVRPQPGGRRHLAVPVRRRGRRGGRRLQRRARTPAGSWVCTRRRRRVSPGRSRPPTGGSSGPRTAWSNGTSGPRSATRDAPPRARRRCSSPDWSSGVRRRATRCTTSCSASWAGSSPPRPNRRAPCWPTTTCGSETPEPGVYSAYFTGETYWAFARLHRLEPDAGWGELADRVGDYMATTRDDAEDHWPPIPDHWAAYGLGGDGGVRGAPGRRAADRRRGGVRRGAGGVLRRSGAVGRPSASDPGAHSPARRTFRAAAATASWARRSPACGGRAGVDARLADIRAPLAERATCIASLAVEQQVDADEAERLSRPRPGARRLVP